MKNICLITPGHISTNPRLVKEASALSLAGFKVHIIFTQYVATQVRHDEFILNANPAWTYDVLNWSATSPLSKLNRLLSKFTFSFSTNICVKINRNFRWQLKKAIANKADLYIAHNLGALPIAVQAAQKNSTIAGFDAEDFHRNEVSDDIGNADVILKTTIEDLYIPQVKHFTAASPLIAERYASLYHKNCTSILNVFSKEALASEIADDNKEPLKLFWFSQTIGPNRGLEAIVKAVNLTGIKMHLHLLGQLTYGYDLAIQAIARPRVCLIKFHDTVAPGDVFKLAKTFDVGLASEPSEPLNRNICLTNKLFTYIQSGLAMALSNTDAQTNFIKTYPTAGQLYTNENQLSAILTAYHHDRDSLKKAKQNNYQLGMQKFNWETESTKFISAVKASLGIN